MSLAKELCHSLPSALINLVLAYYLDLSCEPGSEIVSLGHADLSETKAAIVSFETWSMENCPALDSNPALDPPILEGNKQSIHTLSLSVLDFCFERGRTLQKELEKCSMDLPDNVAFECVSLVSSHATLHLFLRGLLGQPVGPFVIVLETSFPRTSPRVCAIPSFFDIFGSDYPDMKLEDFDFQDSWRPMFTCSLAMLWILMCLRGRRSLTLPVTVAMARHHLETQRGAVPYKPSFTSSTGLTRVFYQNARPDPRVFAEVSDQVTKTYRYIAEFRRLTIEALAGSGMARALIQIVTSYRGIYPSEIALSVFVKDLDGHKYPVRVLEEMCLSEVYDAVYRKYGLMSFCLVYKGMVVLLERTFLDYGVLEGHTINVVSMLRGA